jgi:cation diffusion facilitator CzcD-associated flavoprotein CzcO
MLLLGASGLTALKELLARQANPNRKVNVEVVCYEADSQVGGLWRSIGSKSSPASPTSPEASEFPEYSSSVFQSTVVTTSKE